MSARSWRPGPALLGLLTAWVALFAWSEMVLEPSGFLVTTLAVGLLVVLAGSGLRLLGLAWYAVAALQTLLGLLALDVLYARGESLLGLVPTLASARELTEVLVNGAATLDQYTAPVEVNPTDTRALLVACGLAVVLAVDVLAIGLRRAPLAALPLLVALSVPVSILTDALTLPVFVGTAVLFLRLLAVEHLDRVRAWGHERTRPRQSTWSLWPVSVAAVVVALVAAPLVPVADLMPQGQGAGNAPGSGSGSYRLTAVNPFIKLRRDLVQQTNTPLLFARTQARETSYVRTTVLDRFTSDEWRPSPRNLPSENRASGVLPEAPGLPAGANGQENTWSFQFAPGFSTTWLPLPYPVRRLDVPGSWRFDSRTLDVAHVGGEAPYNLRYRATAFAPSISAAALDAAVRAPTSLRESMTQVPSDLPAVITTRAREVTRGATTDYAKAVALQNWFRQDGGFRYSLEQRNGSGMDLLADFVTDDRVGYCEQFAAAMAAMGRTLGIPSRVVVGFLDGTVERDGRILYTSDDRHAWPEMYFSGTGWVRFEPTPSQRAGATPQYTRQDVDAPQEAATPSTSARPTPAPSPRDPAAGADPADAADQGVDVPWWPIGLLLLVVLVAVAPGVVRRAQRRHRLGEEDSVHLAEGAWAELRATALDLGLDWPEERSPREQARSVVDQVRPGPEDVSSLEGLLQQVERGRYAPAGAAAGTLVDETERSRTVGTVHTWREVMAGSSVGRERRWWLRLWPASVVRGARH